MKNQNGQFVNYSDNYSCAHAWAGQQNQSGYAGNLYFEGNTIFSYGKHFPIATIEGDLVYFTKKKYSNTTSKHKYLVRSAISHKTFVYVEFVPVDIRDAVSKESFIKKNIDFWIACLETTIEAYKLYPRRKTLLEEINNTIYELRSFITALQIKPKGTLKLILEDPSLDAYQKYQVVEKRKARAKENQYLAKAIKNYIIMLSKWENMELRYLDIPNPVDPNLSYLRWNQDSCIVETSKCIQLPEEIAYRFWCFIQNVLHKDYNYSDYKILDFEVKEISADYLIVGCHKIPMRQVKKIAEILKWKMERN